MTVEFGHRRLPTILHQAEAVKPGPVIEADAIRVLVSISRRVSSPLLPSSAVLLVVPTTTEWMSPVEKQNEPPLRFPAQNMCTSLVAFPDSKLR